MDETHVADWDEFEEQIKQLRRQYAASHGLVFRGLGDSTWNLTTTLERYRDVEMLFADYYRVIVASEPEIQTFSKATWDKIEDYPTISKLAREYDAFDLHLW